MPAFCGAAVVLLQESQQTTHDIHLAMIFLGIIAVALVALVVGVLISSAFGAKLLRRLNGIAVMVETKTGPILDQTNRILEDLTPKVESIGANAEHISTTVRSKVEELSTTVSELNDTMREINGRTRAQAKRVDGIVSDALQATEEISQAVQQGIRTPVRQIAGVIAGLRAGFDRFFKSRG